MFDDSANFAVIQCVNGNFKIVTEHGNNLEAAKVSYHGISKSLWNDKNVVSGTVAIIDDKFNMSQQYTDYITHTVEQEEESIESPIMEHDPEQL